MVVLGKGQRFNKIIRIHPLGIKCMNIHIQFCGNPDMCFVQFYLVMEDSRVNQEKFSFVGTTRQVGGLRILWIMLLGPWICIPYVCLTHVSVLTCMLSTMWGPRYKIGTNCWGAAHTTSHFLSAELKTLIGAAPGPALQCRYAIQGTPVKYQASLLVRVAGISRCHCASRCCYTLIAVNRCSSFGELESRHS